MRTNYTQQSEQRRESLPAANEVHIWYADLTHSQAYYNVLLSTLSTDEQKRAERFYFTHDRRRFVSSHAILRNILGGYLGIDATECQFHCGKYGKPELATAHNSVLRFNISHSEELAMYAITNNWEVGIDVEYVCPFKDAEHIARRFFSQQENELLDKVSVEMKQETFFRYWTCKEAVVKAMGDGLFHSLEQINIGTLPYMSTRLLKIAGEAEDNEHCLLQALISPRGYIAALALNGQRGNQPDVLYKQWGSG